MSVSNPAGSVAHNGRARRWARPAAMAVVLFLLGGAASWGLARALIPSNPTAWKAKSISNLRGAEAIQEPLPVSTPHESPWPPVTQRQVDGTFGHRRVMTAHVTQGQTSHQMVVHYFGWPAPCIRDAQFWWLWDDPAWKTDAPNDPPPEILWSGMAINATAFAVAAGLLIKTPWLVRLAVARRRERVGGCRACGYAIGVSPVCTECGAAVGARG